MPINKTISTSLLLIYSNNNDGDYKIITIMKKKQKKNTDSCRITNHFTPFNPYSPEVANHIFNQLR